MNTYAMQVISPAELSFDAQRRLKFGRFVLGGVISLETMAPRIATHKEKGAGWIWYVLDHEGLRSVYPVWPFTGPQSGSNDRITDERAAEEACKAWVVSHILHWGKVDPHGS